MGERPLEPDEGGLILTAGAHRELGVESRLSGKATERQVTVELGLEASHRVDRRQEIVHRQHFKQQNYQRQKDQSVKNV